MKLTYNLSIIKIYRRGVEIHLNFAPDNIPPLPLSLFYSYVIYTLSTIISFMGKTLFVHLLSNDEKGIGAKIQIYWRFKFYVFSNYGIFMINCLISVKNYLCVNNESSSKKESFL